MKPKETPTEYLKRITGITDEKNLSHCIFSGQNVVDFLASYFEENAPVVPTMKEIRNDAMDIWIKKT